MSMSTAVLMCHAPIVIPEIGGARAPECADTTAAMAEAAQRFVRAEPEVLVLVSPHAPRRQTAWGIGVAPRLVGSFARFGHRELALDVPGAPEPARALLDRAFELGLSMTELPVQELDHGALVPLWFLARAGWRGPTLLLAPPYPGHDTELTLGRAIAQVAAQRNERWGIVASGDMSHRLTRNAPAGYHSRAADFDAWVVRAARDSDYQSLVQPDPALRELAAEDVIESVRVAIGAMGGGRHRVEVLRYEAPFGVGYLEAVLYEGAKPGVVAAGEVTRGPELTDIARSAIQAHLLRASFTPPPLARHYVAHGVFVTLRAPTEELRGCLGRTERKLVELAAEVADLAVRAATEDPRMVPIELEEIAALRIEVSLLGEPERIASREQLDPRRYGVIVQSGRKRGVLLPHIEGVSSAQEQVRIASRKAGILADEPVLLSRFSASKVRG